MPEGMSLLDLDVIKMTAQFVSRNGKQFLMALAGRESANPQVWISEHRQIGQQSLLTGLDFSS